MRTYIFLIALLASISLTAQHTQLLYKGEFTGVKCRGLASFQLLPSDSSYIEVSTSDEEIPDYISIYENGSLLSIDVTKKNADLSKLFEKVLIKIYFKELDHIVMEGAGTIETIGPVISERLTANISGTGKIDLELECDDFETTIFGTSVLTTSGTAKHAIVRIEGIGTYNGKDLKCEFVDVKIEGVGTAIVNAEYELKAHLTGVGNVQYVNEPKEKDFSIDGVGNIKKYDE